MYWNDDVNFKEFLRENRVNCAREYWQDPEDGVVHKILFDDHDNPIVLTGDSEIWLDDEEDLFDDVELSSLRREYNEREDRFAEQSRYERELIEREYWRSVL